MPPERKEESGVITDRDGGNLCTWPSAHTPRLPTASTPSCHNSKHRRRFGAVDEHARLHAENEPPGPFHMEVHHGLLRVLYQRTPASNSSVAWCTILLYGPPACSKCWGGPCSTVVPASNTTM